MTTTVPGGVPYRPILRKEDPRLVRGLGRFVDDIALPGMLHLAILRSPVAHARITSIDTSLAESHPKVRLVATGAWMEERGLAWMQTLSGDQQANLVTDKVRFQGQEVAFVVAEDRYAARDALELIDVEYEVLQPVMNARTALGPDAAVIRDDVVGKSNNLCFEWETGDRDATADAFARADVRVVQDMVYPRVHPAPMETCGIVADYDRIAEHLTVHSTSQAPHVHKTLYGRLTGIPEHRIRVIAGDIGGGFGNKVPIYPGYVCAIAASIALGAAVKWIEDRSENLVSTAYARDYVMRGEIAATRDGRVLAIRSEVLADHGAFNGAAVPSKYPAGFFSVFTGSYDIQAAYSHMTAVHTNKAPGGVSYACSFRVTEAVYLVERLMDCLADELSIDPVDLRMRNFIQPEQFPYKTATGWEYDSGDYPATMKEALRIAGYDQLRAEQAELRSAGKLRGIGVSFFTEAVGAGPRRHMDMAGLGMADAARLEITPGGSAVLRISAQSQGQGHETTFAQMVAAELGMNAADVEVVQGDTDRTPFGLGTYGSRSTAVSGAASVIVARQVRDQARELASSLLEVGASDLEWKGGRFEVAGDPGRAVTIADVAAFAFGGDLSSEVEAGLQAQTSYNPPSLTHPCGAYICVVDVDPGTAEVVVRRFIAVDDCGTIINPMIVDGQVHGGLADGVGMALMEMLGFDDDGNCLSASLMDYLIPTALEVPDWETGYTYTPSPHHPIGAKGIGESATVGSPPAVVNAVIDALKPYGVRHADMPLTPSRVWEAMTGRAVPPS